MKSGKCFRIEHRAFKNDLMIMRQCTEIDGKFSFVFYVEISYATESHPTLASAYVRCPFHSMPTMSSVSSMCVVDGLIKSASWA